MIRGRATPSISFNRYYLPQAPWGSGLSTEAETVTRPNSSVGAKCSRVSLRTAPDTSITDFKKAQNAPNKVCKRNPHIPAKRCVVVMLSVSRSNPVGRFTQTPSNNLIGLYRPSAAVMITGFHKGGFEYSQHSTLST